jgi:hypothetical protein
MSHSRYMPLRIIWLIALSMLGLGLFAMLGVSAQPVGVNTHVVAQVATGKAVQTSAARTVDDALGQRLSHIVGDNKPGRQR